MPAVSTTPFTRVTTAFTTSSALYRAAFASLIMAVSASSAFAQVGVGEQVVGGTAQFNRPDNNTLVVTTQQAKTIINWQNLDILNNQSAHFNQQAGANAVTLNRIGGGSPTKILGNLSSNGKLVLVNPNGVFFGAGSRVDVAGLVATTADIGNAAFMNGSTNFNKPGRADASIINKGSITAAEGGLVALVAPSVRNDGVIVAKSGAVKLGAAQTVTVDFYGDNLYSFALGKKADVAGKDENGNDMKSAVENNGTISATGGTIMLTANAAKEVVTNAVNNTGILEASAARVEGGEIILDGGNGNVNLAGVVDVSGKAAGQKGGKVTVTGKNIKLAAAQVDASGATVGGTVKVGGDYQGGGTLAHADKVTMDAASRIDVSATDTGNGGTAILWSDKNTKFDGNIVARGGVNGGDGGLVETSSKGTLSFSGNVDAGVASDAEGNLKGKLGNWLLDPTNITINAGEAFSIWWSLLTNNVTQTADNNITLNENLTMSGLGSLTLNAGNNIIFNNNKSIDATTSIGSVTLNAGNNVTLGTNSKITTGLGGITINNGNVFTADANSLNTGTLSVGGIKVNQSRFGSIQTAINAFGTTGIGGGTLTLGSGVFDQTFQVVGKNNFTVKGQGATGANATIIRPTSMAGVTALKNGPRSDMYSAIALFKDSVLSTVSDLAIDGSAVAGWGTAGLGFYNTNGFITNVDITRGGAFGLWTVADSSLAQTNGIVVANNVASRGNLWAAGAFIGDKTNINIIGGNYDGTGGEEALDLSVGVRGSITNAAITTGNHTGISFHGAHDVIITGGTITGSNANASGIQDDGLTYGIAPTTNVTILGTNMTGVASGVVTNGGSGWNIVGGTYTASNQSGSGAFFKDLTGTNSITGVTLNGFGNGVAANNTDGLLVTGNFINNSMNGIELLNGSDSAVLTANEVKGAYKGVYAELSSGLSILANKFLNMSGFGMDLLHAGGHTIIGNTSTAAAGVNGYGLRLIGGTSSLVSANSFTDFGLYGILAQSSHDLQLLGNSASNVAYGIALTDSDRATMILNVLDNTRTAGIYADNGYGHTLTTNILTNVKGNGIELAYVSDSGLTGNVITAATGNANSGIYSHHFDGANYIGNRYTGNVVTGFGGVGIHAAGNGNATFKYNVLTDNGTGIALTYGSNNSLLEGNVITGSTTGIYTVATSDNTITKNILTGIKGDGISIHTSKGPGWDTNATVTGNIITAAAGNTGSGIVFDQVTKATAGDGTLLGANVVTGFGTGVSVGRSNIVAIRGNGLLGNGTGIDASRVNGLDISGLNVIVATNDGVRVRTADGLTVDGNAIIAGNDGVNIRYAKNFSVDGNGITADRDGVRIADSGYIGSGQPHFTVNGNLIEAERNGVSIVSSYNFDVKDNLAVLAGRNGVYTDQTGWFSIDNNFIVAGDDGVQLNRVNNFDVTGNEIAALRDGVVLDGGNDGLVTANLIGAKRDGVAVEGAGRVDVDGNLVVAGRNGVSIKRAHHFGVDGNVVVAGHDGVHIAESSQWFDVTGNLIGAGNDGVSVRDSSLVPLSGVPDPILDGVTNFTISGNLIGALRDGVNIVHGSHYTVAGNAIGAVRNGVNVKDGVNFGVIGNLILALNDGVHFNDTLDSDVQGNLIGALNNGIHVTNASYDTRITGNAILAGNDGVYIHGSDGNVITGNGILAGRNGITLINSDPLVAGNFIVAGNDGIHANNADDFEVTGNIILAGRDGVHVKNGDNFNIHHNLIGAGRDGVHVRSQTGDAIIASNLIVAGHDGVNSRYTNGLDVNGNIIAAGHDGVRVANAGAFRITGNLIAAGHDGVNIDDSALFAVAGNGIIAGHDGVHVTDAGLFAVAGNGIIAGHDGVNVNRASTFLIASNDIFALHNGVRVNNAGLFAIADNDIIALNDGISVNSSGLYAIALNDVIARRDGIHLTKAFGNIVLGNNIIAGRDGIYGRSLLGSVIAGNNVYYAGRDGIHLHDAAFNVIALNDVYNARRHGFNLDNADYSLIAGNTAENSGRSGFRLNATRDSLLWANTADGNDIGFNIVGGSDNITLVDNIALNNRIGARVANSDDIVFLSNHYTNNRIGARIINTNDTVFDGEIFTGNTLGIDLNNSDNTRIEDTSITTAAGGTGIRIRNGSGDTIVRNLEISGGKIGVLIDGPGSNMQFEGDTSRFAGNMNYYFVLRHNAMQGETLDASQQFFNGTRGVDMSFAQWQAAEAKTIDAESKNPIGNVFYTNWENQVQAAADLSALDEAERKRKGLYRTGLFSYAGKTLNNNIEEKPFSFQIASLDLSLLNKVTTNPQTPASIANFFATLAPAAGGNANPADMAQQMAALAPAAGGNMMGGVAADDSAANTFLDAGANLDYAAQ